LLGSPDNYLTKSQIFYDTQKSLNTGLFRCLGAPNFPMGPKQVHHNPENGNPAIPYVTGIAGHCEP
jgi:hypothetical protein